jgi:uncharacterized protein YkwD
LGFCIGAVLAAALALPVGTLGASAISSAPGGAGAVPGAPASAHTHAKPSTCAGSNLRPTRANAAAVDAATLCLIDRIRATLHLGPLRTNHELQTVASTQVNDMVRRNYFADDRPTGQTPASLIAETHYSTHAVKLSTGQNIGWGTGSDATPARMVAAWMASPPHREIILVREYRDAGVGVVAAVPSFLAPPQTGATYAIELAARG